MSDECVKHETLGHRHYYIYIYFNHLTIYN